LKAVAGVDKGALAEASRGCPWACEYCAKGPVRSAYSRRRLEFIKSEIRQLKKLGYNYAFFIDETFNLNSEALTALLETLKVEDMRFGFQGRADLVDEQMANYLAASGCVYAELGIDLIDDSVARNAGRRQRRVNAERGLKLCQAAIPIVRFNRLNARTYDFSRLYPQHQEFDWSTPADPVFPYPGAPFGERLMAAYGRTGFDWEFAERYSWWLRHEVRMQRAGVPYTDDVLAEMKDSFLNLSRSTALYLARVVEDQPVMSDFYIQNRTVLGHGGRLDLHHTGKERRGTPPASPGISDSDGEST
jgi:hypothetical protein